MRRTLDAQEARAAEDDVRALMTRLQEAWRKRDVKGYLEHFTEDADLVNRGGAWMQGKQEIAQQFDWLAQNGLPEIFTAEVTVEAVRLVTSDFAIVHQRREESARSSRATYVLAKSGPAWRVEAVSIAPIEASRR